MKNYHKAGLALGFAVTAFWPALTLAHHNECATFSSGNDTLVIIFHSGVDPGTCVLASIKVDPNDTVTVERSFSADGGNISVSSPGHDVDKDIN